MSDQTVVRLRGEGGGEWEFELPLSEVFADQVKARTLTPADDDSAAAVAHLFEEQAAAAATEDSGGELTLEQRIEAVDGHAAANALADELGVDGFTEKKPSVADKKKALAAKAAELAAAGAQQE